MSVKANRKPNIVFILVDDMGWRDLSCTGSTYYETPHVDRLARDGMMFTQAYQACSLCSPSRAAIFTGKAPARIHLTQIIGIGNINNMKNQIGLNHFLQCCLK